MLPACGLPRGSQSFGLHWKIPLSLIFSGGHLGVRNQKCCMPWLSWGGINVTWTSHPLSPGRWELFWTGQGYMYKCDHGHSDVGIPWSAIIGLTLCICCDISCWHRGGHGWLQPYCSLVSWGIPVTLQLSSQVFWVDVLPLNPGAIYGFLFVCFLTWNSST